MFLIVQKYLYSHLNVFVVELNWTVSTNREKYTIKFLVGISPGELITYISKLYEAKASDKIIFEQSELVNKMSTFDAIMVDKGFSIDTICNSKGIKVFRPPFLTNKNKF